MRGARGPRGPGRAGPTGRRGPLLVALGLGLGLGTACTVAAQDGTLAPPTPTPDRPAIEVPSLPPLPPGPGAADAVAPAAQTAAAPAADGSGGPGPGRPVSSLLSSETAPLELTADEFVYRRGPKPRISYLGNVVARQADTSLECWELVLRLDENRQITGGTCTGAGRPIRLVQDESETGELRVVTAERAEMSRAEDRIVLTGDVTVSDRRNRIEGEKAEVFVSEERVVMRGSERPVVAELGGESPEPGSAGPWPDDAAGPAPGLDGEGVDDPAAGGASPAERFPIFRGGGEPIRVRSYLFEADRRTRRIQFKLDVRASQAGVSGEGDDGAEPPPEVTLETEVLTVQILAGDNDVDWIEADRDVVVRHGPQTATGDRLVYRRGAERIELQGNPAVFESAEGELRCATMSYDQLSRQLECKGRPLQRMKMVIEDPEGAAPEFELR